jgi:hypothetical protein
MYHCFKLEGVHCEAIFTKYNRIYRQDTGYTAVILDGPLRGYEIIIGAQRWREELSAYEVELKNQGELPL